MSFACLQAQVHAAPGWGFWCIVLAALVLFLGIAWVVVMMSRDRERRQWPQYQPVAGQFALRLLPYEESTGVEDEDDEADPVVRRVRREILESFKGFRLFKDGCEGSGFRLQPILGGKLDGHPACVFHCYFRSIGTRGSPWLSDKTVVGVEGSWRLPRLVLLPRGAGAALGRALDAVDYDLDDVEEQPCPGHIQPENYLLLARNEGDGRSVPDDAWRWLAQHPGLTVEAEGGKLLVFRGNRSLAPGPLAGLMQEVRELLGLLAPR